MNDRPHRPVAALVWMGIASVFFSVMSLCARHVADAVPWAQMAAMRGAMAWVVAISVAKARGLSLSITDKRLSWGRAILGTISMLVTFYLFGQPSIPLGDISAIAALSPIMIALAAPPFLGERTGRRVWLATPIGFVGVLVLIQPNFHIAGHLALLALFGTAVSSAAMILLRKLGGGETPEAVATHFAAVSALTCTVLSIPTFAVPAPAPLAWLIASGVAGGLGQLSMTHAYALDNAARVGAAGYIGTVVTIVLAHVLLGEPTSTAQVSGSAMVILAGLILAAGAFKAHRLIKTTSPISATPTPPTPTPPTPTPPTPHGHR